MRISHQRSLRRDLGIVGVSIAVAIAAQQFGWVELLLTRMVTLYWLGAIAAGVLYSSIFTVAPATVALATLATRLPVWQVAFLGGCGAMLGDLIIFRFLRSTVAIQILDWAHRRHRRLWHTFSRRRVQWPLAILGALIIASPLPDEIGLSLMGITRLPERWMAPISLLLNGFGIYVIGLVATAVV